MTRNEKRAIIRENLVFLQGGRANAVMAAIIGAKTGTTWKTRLTNPDTLTVGEAEKLCAAYKVDIAGLLTKKLKIE